MEANQKTLLYLYLLVLAAALVGGLIASTAYADELTSDRTGDNQLCTSCHPSVIRVLAHRRIDAKNIGKAACLLCHQPHTSVQESSNQLRQPEQSRCISCHYRFSSYGGNSGRQLHEPVRDCTNCHQPHDSGREPKPVAAKEVLCTNCHAKEANKLTLEHQHQPFANRQCTSCHDPHFANRANLLIADYQQLCKSCHVNREGAMGLATKHQPYQQGNCTACHDPHASDFDQQLVAAPGELCYNCHATIAQKTNKAVVHQPFGKRQCLSCHDPHASATANLLKGGTTQQLCYSCHGELEQLFTQASHHPVGERIECTSCHEPHGGDFRKLQVIEGNELCFSCHQGKKLFYANIQHSTMPGVTFAGACLNCHEPHGNTRQSLLIKSATELCASCHPAMRFGNGVTHPVDGEFIDPDKGQKLTCSSTCHDPHGTAYKFNVTKQNDALCLNCHNDKMAK